MVFDVQRQGPRVALPGLSVCLNLPGRHNVLDGLAAIAVATGLGVLDEVIADALDEFTGVGRRFALLGDFKVPAASGGGTFTVVDDYGHHPTEMQATLEAARGAWPDRRLVVVFRPHRYTRTRDWF